LYGWEENMSKIIFLLNSKSRIKKEALQEVLNVYLKKSFLIKEQLKQINFPETPFNRLTFLGAKKRALVLKKFILKNQSEIVLIGLESGLVKRNSIWFEECWCYLIYKDKFYYGYSSGFPLPKNILKKLKIKKHKEIMKEMEAENNILSKDTWAHYSKNLISRKESIKEAFRNALISFLIDNNFKN
jgi:non-canonical (house-cleaning) NTP pyrophosphatase